MLDHFEVFKRFLRNFVQMSEGEMDNFIQQCDRVDFLKGDFIIKAGEAQNNLFFITLGQYWNRVDI
jgi:signal-transduction protein with cAMP-binding, CBS, and nucleotidyltransferase domain